MDLVSGAGTEFEDYTGGGVEEGGHYGCVFEGYETGCCGGLGVR